MKQDSQVAEEANYGLRPNVAHCLFPDSRRLRTSFTFVNVWGKTQKKNKDKILTREDYMKSKF